MSAKRPRPAIPVLVHVDNPTEAGSVTVDTSTIEGKMDTVITNQNRIYDKIPTSSGGGAADLTTINEKITALAETIGSVDSVYTDNNLIGKVKNLALSAGEFGGTISSTGTGLRSLLYNVRESIGEINSTLPYNGLSVRSLLANIRNSIGIFNTQIEIDDTSIRSFLYNIRNAIGSGSHTPTATEATVRGLLTAIKENTASGGGGGGGSADLTTVNEKTTALAAAIGSASDDSSTVSVIGLLKSITDKY